MRVWRSIKREQIDINAADAVSASRAALPITLGYIIRKDCIRVSMRLRLDKLGLYNFSHTLSSELKLPPQISFAAFP